MLNWRKSENEYSLQGIHLPFPVKIKKRHKSLDPEHEQYFIAHVNGFVGNQVKTFKEAEKIAIEETEKLLSSSLKRLQTLVTLV